MSMVPYDRYHTVSYSNSVVWKILYEGSLRIWKTGIGRADIIAFGDSGIIRAVNLSHV